MGLVFARKHDGDGGGRIVDVPGATLGNEGDELGDALPVIVADVEPETTQSPPVHARHAPTVGETQLLLQTIRNEGGYPTNLIARMLYGCVMMPHAQPGLGISGRPSNQPHGAWPLVMAASGLVVQPSRGDGYLFGCAFSMSAPTPAST